MSGYRRAIALALFAITIGSISETNAQDITPSVFLTDIHQITKIDDLTKIDEIGHILGLTFNTTQTTPWREVEAINPPAWIAPKISGGIVYRIVDDPKVRGSSHLSINLNTNVLCVTKDDVAQEFGENYELSINPTPGERFGRRGSEEE
jgi:hypothetical protein